MPKRLTLRQGAHEGVCSCAPASRRERGLGQRPKVFLEKNAEGLHFFCFLLKNLFFEHFSCY